MLCIEAMHNLEVLHQMRPYEIVHSRVSRAGARMRLQLTGHENMQVFDSSSPAPRQVQAEAACTRNGARRSGRRPDN